MNTKQPANTLEKVDGVIFKVAKIYSFLGVIAIVIMSLLAVGDILAAKLFASAIPNQYQWVQYLLIVAVFTVMPSIILSRGLMAVDILTKNLPKPVLKAIEFLSYICGTVIFGFLCYRGFILMAKHFAEKTASANQTGAFPIWPFTLIYAVSLVLVSLACLWRAIRTVAASSEKPTPQKGEEGGHAK